MTNEYENTLRRIITSMLGSDDSTKFGVTTERIEKWKEKREIETKKYKGLIGENRIIYFSDFYDLKNIILKNWNIFEPIFIKKKRFEVFFDEVEKYRNTTAHGRELYSYQLELLNGIIEDLKSHFIIYHNKNMDANDFFIRILKISDSFGSVWEINSSLFFSSGKILRVGDTIEFNIDAFDPKGRKIEYCLIAEGVHIKSDNSIISTTITNKMVSKFAVFRLTAKTENQDYENHTVCEIDYVILP
jgi:hypothetical protein